MLSGILSLTEGFLTILGYNFIKERKKLARHIGTVFGQKSQLWIHLPSIETFMLLGVLYVIDKNVLNQKKI